MPYKKFNLGAAARHLGEAKHATTELQGHKKGHKKLQGATGARRSNSGQRTKVSRVEEKDALIVVIGMACSRYWWCDTPTTFLVYLVEVVGDVRKMYRIVSRAAHGHPS